MKSNFENSIKDTLNRLSFDYDPKQWESLKGKIKPKPRFSNIKYYAIAGAVAAVAILGVLYFNANPTKVQQKIAENTIQNQSKKVLKQTNEQEQLGKKIANEVKNQTIKDYYLSPKVKNVKDDKKEQSSSSKTQNKVQSSKATNKNSNQPINNLGKKDVNPQATNQQSIIALQPRVSKSSICLGGELQFSNKSETGVNYTWNFGDNQFAKGASVSHIYQNAGEYIVTLTVTKGSEKQTANINVKVNAQPNIDFTWQNECDEHSGNKLFYPYTVITATTNDMGGTYKWQVGDKTFTNPGVSTIIKEKGTYTASLTYTDNHGCSSTIIKDITIDKPFTPYAPNAFTPNGDGDNDVFIPKALLAYDIPFTLAIYSRTNQLVFKTDNVNAPWNGEMNNQGKLLPNDTYLWVLVTQDDKGQSHIFKGTISIVR